MFDDGGTAALDGCSSHAISAGPSPCLWPPVECMIKGSGMFRVHRKIRMVLGLLAVLTTAQAGAVEFAPVFNNGTVLQAALPVNIWGRAEPGATVKVTFAGQEKSTISDKEGRWMLQLDPLEPSAEPRALTASGAGATASIADVVGGEVWIAAGQSNMVWPLSGSEGGTASLAKTLPLIRFVIVPRQAGLPARPFTLEQLAWRSFAPGNNRKLAAVAFHFAEYLQNSNGLPAEPGQLDLRKPAQP